MVHVAQCTDVGCDKAAASHPVAPAGPMFAFAADGPHLVSVVANGLAGPDEKTVSITSCPAGRCPATAVPVATAIYGFSRQTVAVATMFAETRNNPQTTLHLCADRGCGRMGRRIDLPGLAGPSPLSLRILPDGRPVLLAGGNLVICADAACRPESRGDRQTRRR